MQQSFTTILEDMWQQKYTLQMPKLCHTSKLLNLHRWLKYINKHATHEVAPISYVARVTEQSWYRKMMLTVTMQDNKDGTAQFNILNWQLG